MTFNVRKFISRSSQLVHAVQRLLNNADALLNLLGGDDQRRGEADDVVVRGLGVGRGG